MPLRKTLLLLFLLSVSAADAAGDSTLCAFSRQYITTDPSKGIRLYTAWAEFPSSATAYRNVRMLVSLQCPDKLMCGEWDYCDHIDIKRIGGKNAKEISLEIGRLLTPYGRRYGPEWSFTWQLDITDFAALLHDSVEIQYGHSGYEPANDRGWLLSVCFEITTGPPAMPLLAMDTVFYGNVPYGDSSRPVENYLKDFRVKPVDGAWLGRCRILQTGHGMDEPEGCAEFCAKNRDILWDGKVEYHKLIWKECASNPLFPQAGTWIFDRANWCPGELNKPDVYDFSMDTRPHTLKIVMQEYHSPKPSAQYSISAYFMQFGKPKYAIDATVEEILIPSIWHEYSRLGQVTDSPGVIVRNLGFEKITSLNFRYGYNGNMSNAYTWKGDIESQQKLEVSLPPAILPAMKSGFEVNITKVNGKKDGYPADNSRTSVFNPPPLMPGRMLVFLQTNGEAVQNELSLKDASGKVFLHHQAGKLDSNTVYRDTLNLPKGVYSLQLSDTAGDGLEFWYNTKGGKGIMRLMTIDGRLLKNFNPDFGNDINYTFSVGDETLVSYDTAAILEVFPIRNQGRFFVDVFFPARQNLLSFQFLKPDSSLAMEKHFYYLKEGRLDFDISALPDAIYILRIIAEQGVYFRRVKLVH